MFSYSRLSENLLIFFLHPVLFSFYFSSSRHVSPSADPSTSPLVFGIPLEKCIRNDRELRLYEANKQRERRESLDLAQPLHNPATLNHLIDHSISVSRCAQAYSIRCWSPNVTRSVVMVSWFTRMVHCACAPMLYILELCEDCAVANEIDYAWASIHDNAHVITACDV